MLKVEAIGAQDLKKYDVLGKSDPFLEVFTLPLHKVRPQMGFFWGLMVDQLHG